MNSFLCQGALRRIGKHLFSHITGKPVGTITYVKFLASPWQSLNCFSHSSRCSHVPILCKDPRCLMKLLIKCAFLIIYLSPWPTKNILTNDILVVLETSEGTRTSEQKNQMFFNCNLSGFFHCRFKFPTIPGMFSGFWGSWPSHRNRREAADCRRLRFQVRAIGVLHGWRPVLFAMLLRHDVQ